ncbi:hypothetical protein [Aliivibrio kagoshimensis]|uniref:hypothetical protein n=1 Tax=Aliivibrio kagoshimensis TaxID=2910230 RepID=UPI003D0D0FC3
MDDLHFTFRVVSGEVTIFHHDKKATVLRGQKAAEFCQEVEDGSFSDGQQLMARLTGNYKRGNERQAKNSRKSRYNY